MADQVQIRRGTAALVAAFTGAQGELTMATDTNRLQVHDNATPGGHPQAFQSETIIACTDSGSANAIMVNSNIGPTGLVDGMVLRVLVAAANTGAVTVNYNSTGAIALVLASGATIASAGKLQANAYVLMSYSAALTKWVLLAGDGGMPQFPAPLPINQGGTGANTAAGAVANLGLTEALVFAGTWNASTNTPTLTSGTGTPGALYRVTTAGSTALDGISIWAVGDSAVFNGITNTWEKIDNSGISVSAGASSAGQNIVANAAGDLDVSFLPNGSVIPGVTPFTGYYNILNIVNATGLGTAVPNSNARQYFHPFMVFKPTVVSQLGMNVTTGSAGTTFSCGIYADNGGSGGFNGPTGNPLCSVSGLSSATAGLVMGSVGTSITLQPGIIYWVSYAFSSVAATFSAAANSSVVQTGANASGFLGNLYLPTTGPTLLSPITGTFTGNQANRLCVYQG